MNNRGKGDKVEKGEMFVIHLGLRYCSFRIKVVSGKVKFNQPLVSQYFHLMIYRFTGGSKGELAVLFDM
ncbi:hypothetical protein BCD64_02945 [Nostoc sp. MBR 210]|nr:hypothetical protein BCD64_02945 [Nostoc sp. MBR 210]